MPDAVQVNANADEDLHRTKGEVKRAGEGAQRLRGGAELGLELRRHESRHCAIGLT